MAFKCYIKCEKARLGPSESGRRQCAIYGISCARTTEGRDGRSWLNTRKRRRWILPRELLGLKYLSRWWACVCVNVPKSS
jgi:hypothetical protein